MSFIRSAGIVYPSCINISSSCTLYLTATAAVPAKSQVQDPLSPSPSISFHLFSISFPSLSSIPSRWYPVVWRVGFTCSAKPLKREPCQTMGYCKSLDYICWRGETASGDDLAGGIYAGCGKVICSVSLMPFTGPELNMAAFSIGPRATASTSIPMASAVPATRHYWSIDFPNSGTAHETYQWHPRRDWPFSSSDTVGRDF